MATILLGYLYWTSLGPKRDVPSLEKSFIRGGSTILYGPFTSPAFTEHQTDHSVTLATHTSLKNFYRLQILSLVWKSPISVAVWAQGDLTRLLELVYTLTLVCAQGQSISISIVVPSHLPHSVDLSQISWDNMFAPSARTCSQRTLHNHFYELRALDPSANYASQALPYPNNMLRNLALSSIQTTHVLVTDIDILPSVHMDEQFMKYMHDSGDAVRSSDAAYVVPVFESEHSQKNQWRMDRLLEEWRTGRVRPFYHSTCPQCQGPTQYTKWIERQSRIDSTELVSSLVPYVPGWEPFIVMRTDAHPDYDERFKQFGYNRMSLICELYLSGTKFQVFDRMFLVHDGFKEEVGFHAEKDRELHSNALLYQTFMKEKAKIFDTKKRC